MPLSEQETHCIKKTCDHLSTTLGGNWVVHQVLDDLHPNEKTPEVLVTNGNIKAAIEVKRLTGDSASQEYKEYLFHCLRRLVPSYGGYYTLTPPLGFYLPFTSKMFRRVKSEVERVGLTLGDNEEGVIRVPRSGYISASHATASGNVTISPMIFCQHCGLNSDVWVPVTKEITGRFMLVDEREPQHSFITEECRKAFQDKVVAACVRRLCGDAAAFSWDEEWVLTRLGKRADEKESDGVYIFASTQARSVKDSVAECVHLVLSNAIMKFEKRWGDYHILVLDKKTYAPVEYVTNAIQAFEAEEIEKLDYIFMVDDEDVTQIYPTPGVAGNL